MKLIDKLYTLYSELISLESEYEQKKEIDFAIELDCDVEFLNKIIEKSDILFNKDIITAIKDIENRVYSSEEFTHYIFKKIIKFEPYKNRIESIDMRAFDEISERFDVENEFIEEVKSTFNIGFLIHIFEVIQLLNSYNYLINNKPIKYELKLFIRTIIKGINKIQEEIDINELQKLFEYKKHESIFRDYMNLFLNGAGYETIPESKKGNNRIDLKIQISDSVFKIEFKGWWNNDKNEIINQLNKYLTDIDEYGFIFMINNLKNKNIVTNYSKLIQSEKFNYLKGSFKPIQIDKYEFYESKHLLNNNLEKNIYHFIYNLY